MTGVLPSVTVHVGLRGCEASGVVELQPRAFKRVDTSHRAEHLDPCAWGSRPHLAYSRGAVSGIFRERA